ncbi:asparagine synthase-related protein [Brevundimonas naejangsanensis]|uniref:asparagine synthase-related protein n=1 Tax=Brevundimonas naejangsanensis TaxID=588932 RepID=UPI00320ABC5D
MAADTALILVGDNPAALDALVAPFSRRLARAGWSRRSADPFVRVYSPTAARVEVTPALDGHGVLIGDIYDSEGRAVAARERGVLGCRRLDPDRARSVCANYWGRYLLVRRADGDVAILRDPSGALECVVWRKGGVTLIATGCADVIDPWLPEDLAIDWDEVVAMVRRPGEHRHALPLSGLQTVAAGELRTIRVDTNHGEQIWSPAEVYRRGRGRPAPDLRAVVQQTVRSLAGDRAWVVEVSGGLDSAIVAASLSADQRERVAAWVNHYVDQPEGDERPYARAVVAPFGGVLTEVRRDGLGLDGRRLAQSANGFRPAINDIDPDYNADIAKRIEATGAWGSLTGQGGDAVFFQMPTLLVGVDELCERGLQARGAVIHRLARWLRKPAWPTVLGQSWHEHLKDRKGWDHPWLDDLKGVPPAKALQISVLAFCQSFQAEAVRSRLGPCINPLLSQPVMEAGLAMSTVDLTWGGRDRSAARAAFRDVLPHLIFDRRSKGELSAYYGEAVAGRLGFLRDYLLGGALAEAGLIRLDFDDQLSRDAMVWKGGHSELLTLALIEAWVRRWKARLAALRP